jgi:sec-independent protein translocase protein TatB
MLNIGWGEFLILVVGGLFILGPERLPSAAAWLGRTVRQVREYATGAREQLRTELGPEFDELRQPLEELRDLRGLRSRGLGQLLDGSGGESFGGAIKPNGYASPTGQGVPIPRPLQPGERAPFDPDAT